jgi:hypothetical protein
LGAWIGWIGSSFTWRQRVTGGGERQEALLGVDASTVVFGISRVTSPRGHVEVLYSSTENLTMTYLKQVYHLHTIHTHTATHLQVSLSQFHVIRCDTWPDGPWEQSITNGHSAKQRPPPIFPSFFIPSLARLSPPPDKTAPLR